MDNKYLVFTRKWRPKTFAEIVGQEQVTLPLTRAIETGRIMHAYLFSGPRGVGKTTTARVFAKALNCEKGPTPTPCGVCGSCTETSEGSALDVIEIDGASNNGVEEIRELREHVGFSAARGKYKIYIIDEVHMLSNSAFNAFLKTLEEPPAHVIFIFATTDPAKIPQTILSRCQHFRFRRMPVNLIIENLKMIAKNEKINCDDDAYFMIAKAADGALRDAQRIFDQAFTYVKGGKLTAAAVSEMLGEAGIDLINSLVLAIAGRDIKAALLVVEQVIEAGYDLKHFLFDLTTMLREMAVIRAVDSREISKVGDDEYTFLKKASSIMERERTLYLLQKALETGRYLERSGSSEVALEAFVIDACMSGAAAAADMASAAGVKPTAKAVDAVQQQTEAARDTATTEGHIIIESIEEKEQIKKLSKEIVEKHWQNIIERASDRQDLARAMETAGVVSYDEPNLFIVGENPFMTKILVSGKEVLRKIIGDELGIAPVLVIMDREEYRRKHQVKKAVDEEEAKNHPIIKDLGKIFKISEIDVKKPQK
ncbi:MAG TPA: DNA polymerase III subunit gamma/tau [Candidatus Goldiibacteriota bacterium]|nr:DNA polymerase III subunit gamma/tau [Candidatus Goldiibacteriota bacterium]